MAASVTYRLFSAAYVGRIAVAALFVLNIVLLVYLNRWRLGGIPVRALTMATLFLVCFAVYWPIMKRTILRFRLVLIFLSVIAATGLLVSLSAGSPPGPVARQILEIHIQAFLTFLVTAVIAQIFGLRFVTFTLMAVVGLSAAVALVQYVGVGPAWDLRLNLNALMDIGAEKAAIMNRMDRPMGLSLDPVVFATEICLVFCVLWIWRHARTRGAVYSQVDVPILIFIALFVIASLATGNRSPILGMMVFTGLYAVMANRLALLLLPLTGILGLVLLPSIMELLSATGIRVFSTGDASAVGRAPLRDLGIRLFLDRPLGYGLLFDPRDYWDRHWGALFQYENASIVQRQHLHNYVLTMLNMYGVALVFPAVFVAYAMAMNWRIVFPFIAYGIHILFHNTGPLQGNAMLWVVLPLALLVLPQAQAQSRYRTRNGSTRLQSASV